MYILNASMQRGFQSCKFLSCINHYLFIVAVMHLNYAAIIVTSGPRLNIKTVLSTYGDFHVKDKTAVRTSYL